MKKFEIEEWDPILPHRALYLCNGENPDCKKTGCALIGEGECIRTQNVVYAKNGPVKDVRDWETRFEVLQMPDGLLYYVEKESS